LVAAAAAAATAVAEVGVMHTGCTTRVGASAGKFDGGT
jgi:hypothetical protein